MQRKFFLLKNAILLLAFGLASCSRNSHVEYTGHYKPGTKGHVFDRAREEGPGKLSTESMDESLTASINEEPAVTSIQTQKRTTVNYATHDPSDSRKTTTAAEQKAVKAAATASVEKAHTDYFSTDRKIQRGLKQSYGGSGAALYCLLAILLPPLAVGLWEDGVTSHFWWCCLFTILFWVPGIIYAWIIIL